MTQSFGQLKQAQAKFQDGLESLKRIETTEQRKMLIPLTNSLYVPGVLTEKKVMVDVGTGYFVEKDLKAAQEFYKTKVNFIKTNLDSLHASVTQRQNQKAVLMDVLQSKLMELRSQSSKAQEV